MARATNILGIKGRLGGVVMYTLNGKYIARTVGEVEKARYKHAPEFQQMRESNSEFGGAATIGKALRQGLMPYAKHFADPYVTGRLNAVLKRMISLGPGTRGKRLFEVQKQRACLEGFCFHKNHPLSRYFNPGMEVGLDKAKQTVRLSCESFMAEGMVSAPRGATHFQLACAVAALADYRYSEALGAYEAVHDISRIKGQALSAVLDLNDVFDEGIVMDVKLPRAFTKVVNFREAGLVVCGGIVFLKAEYCKESGEYSYYELMNGRAFDVLGVL